MLILSQPIATSVVIDGNIRIHVLGVDTRHEVKIGIETRNQLSILHNELWKRSTVGTLRRYRCAASRTSQAVECLTGCATEKLT